MPAVAKLDMYTHALRKSYSASKLCKWLSLQGECHWSFLIFKRCWQRFEWHSATWFRMWQNECCQRFSIYWASFFSAPRILLLMKTSYMWGCCWGRLLMEITMAKKHRNLGFHPLQLFRWHKYIHNYIPGTAPPSMLGMLFFPKLGPNMCQKSCPHMVRYSS